MPDPYNYTLNIPNPAQNVMQGVQQGFQLGQQIEQTQLMRQQQEAAQLKAQRDEQARMAAAEEQALIQQELAEASQSRNPTDALTRLMVRRPQLAEQLKTPFAALSEKEKSYKLAQAQQVYSAVISGSPQTAIDLLRRDAAAYKEAGRTQDAQLLEDMAKTIELKPEVAATATGAFLSAQMGPEQFAAAFKNVGEGTRQEQLQPAVMQEQTAKTQKAITEAEFAESKAVMDLQLSQAQIKKMQADSEVARLNAQVAAANAAYNRESNELKRAELGLKVQELRDARDMKVREKVAEGDTAMNSIESAVTLADKILADEDSLRAATGGMAIRGAIPGTKARTVAGQLEQLSNTLAATNLDKLKGAISDKDIAFLKSIEANLDRYQNEDAAIKEIKRVRAILKTARNTIAEKYGKTIPQEVDY